MHVVTRIVRATASKWSTVMTRSSFSSRRMGMTSVRTIARPEWMAPATKYGAKIVVCHPGRLAIAKSHDTTEWTETTSGVARAAKKRYPRP